jgi:hypothetical protein
MDFRRSTAAIFAVITVMLSVAVPNSWSADGGFSPDRTAWRLTIKPEKFEKYVDFPASNVGSVIRISVFHESVDPGKTSKPVHYKNFYYNRDGKILGSKQVTPVSFPPDTRGPIVVKIGPQGATPEISTAAANVAVRLYLDLYTSKNFPQFIVVQDEMFDGVIAGVKRSGFKPFTIPRPLFPKPKAVMVLKSERSDKFQYMMYL